MLSLFVVIVVIVLLCYVVVVIVLFLMVIVLLFLVVIVFVMVVLLLKVAVVVVVVVVVVVFWLLLLLLLVVVLLFFQWLFAVLFLAGVFACLPACSMVDWLVAWCSFARCRSLLVALMLFCLLPAFVSVGFLFRLLLRSLSHFF